MQTNKGSATVILLVVLVVVLAGGLAYTFLKKPSEVAVSPTPTPIVSQKAVKTATPTPKATVDPTAGWKSDAENIVSVFMENVNIPGYGNNINIAFDKLTSSAQATVRSYSPNTTLAGLASGLAYFVGVQEAPDKGTSIVSSQKLDGDTVKVSTKWNYGGSSPTTKIFTLVLENGQWKINKVQ